MNEAVAERLAVGLIGDVVRSRDHPDQRALLARIQAGLERVNERRPALQPLQITIGDEFQAVYAGLADAIAVTLEIRLILGLEIRLRFGIGRGEVQAYDLAQLPLGQSGSAWWRAREAMDELMQIESRRRWPRTMGTLYRSGDPAEEGSLNALLILRDQILGGMDEKDYRITLGLLEGSNQEELSQALEIGQPSVSRRQMENGPIALYRAQQLLEVSQ